MCIPLIRQVRNAVVNLFLQLQSLVLCGVLMSAESERVRFSKMCLEWDETGQSMRLRRGLIEVEGVMPVLVSCQSQCH